MPSAAELIAWTVGLHQATPEILAAAAQVNRRILGVDSTFVAVTDAAGRVSRHQSTTGVGGHPPPIFTPAGRHPSDIDDSYALSRVRIRFRWLHSWGFEPDGVRPGPGWLVCGQDRRNCAPARGQVPPRSVTS
jgi:hypothetical protein